METLTEKELAEKLHRSYWTVRDWRLKDGMPYIKIRSRYYYELESVIRWLEQRKVAFTEKAIKESHFVDVA